MKTNIGLVEYAKAQVGKPYWYGTYGQTATEALLKSKKNQYPAYYNYNDFNKQIGQRVHDCSGLVKGYLFSDTTTSAPKYNSSYDKSAYGFYLASKERGDKTSFPYKNGTLVYKSSNSSAITIHHIGVYCTDGYVYEAKGHEWGVVKTKFKPTDWQFWSICPYITYENTGSTTAETKPTQTKKSVEEVAKEVIAGKYGNGDARKKALASAGYDYNTVQAKVNELLGTKTSTSKKSNEEIAKEVIKGKWGNGNARKSALTKAGYDYAAVQAIVNKLLKG